jgi:hypothetical protein
MGARCTLSYGCVVWSSEQADTAVSCPSERNNEDHFIGIFDEMWVEEEELEETMVCIDS